MVNMHLNPALRYPPEWIYGVYKEGGRRTYVYHIKLVRRAGKVFMVRIDSHTKQHSLLAIIEEEE